MRVFLFQDLAFGPATQNTRIPETGVPPAGAIRCMPTPQLRQKIGSIVEDVRAITDTLVALGLDPKPPDIFPAMPTTVFSGGW